MLHARRQAAVAAHAASRYGGVKCCYLLVLPIAVICYLLVLPYAVVCCVLPSRHDAADDAAEQRSWQAAQLYGIGCEQCSILESAYATCTEKVVGLHCNPAACQSCRACALRPDHCLIACCPQSYLLVAPPACRCTWVALPQRRTLHAPTTRLR
jgi:hypothetical protein